MGKRVVLVKPGLHLGGMTSGRLSAIFNQQSMLTADIPEGGTSRLDFKLTLE